MSGTFDDNVDEEIWAKERASYLKRRYNLRESLADVIAWSELGYSSSGISKHVDVTQDTVKAMLDEITDKFCIEATFSVPEEERTIKRGLPE